MSAEPCNREVVLVLDAETVTARHTAPLTRIMHGYSASQIIAIAADTSDAAQLDHLIDRVEHRFGHAVDRIVSTAGDAHRLALAS